MGKSTVKFVRHDMNACREAEARWCAVADGLHPKHSPAWFAEVRLQDLADAGANGLPDCYREGFGQSWQADFYAGFPWREPDRSEAVRLVLADPRFGQVEVDFYANHRFNIREELEEALRLFGEQEPLVTPVGEAAIPGWDSHYDIGGEG